MIVAKFAFYWEMGDPIPSYLVIKSDNPQLPVGGNVDANTLKTHQEAIPATISYKEWVAIGRPVYRGEGALI